MKVRLMFSLCALAALAGALTLAFSAAASGPGPHWTVEGVAQESGTETVSYSGSFGIEFEAGNPSQIYGCKKTTGSGKLLFTSPGTGEGHIELSECRVYSSHSSECTLAEPIIINMKVSLSSTEGVAYATLEPAIAGSAFTYFGVENAVEKTCPSTANLTGEHVMLGSQGTKVNAENVEDSLETTTTGTSLKLALGEHAVRIYGALKQAFTGKDAGKKLGAK